MTIDLPKTLISSTDPSTLSSVFQLFTHLDQPQSLWQITILFIALLTGWLGQRHLTKRLSSDTKTAGRMNRHGFMRLSGPVIALLLIYTSNHILKLFYTTHLLELALSLLLSLAFIRFIVLVIIQALGHHSWLDQLTKWVATTAWIIVALHILGWLPIVTDELEAISFNLGTQRISLLMLLQGIIMVITTVVTALWASSILERRLAQKSNLDANVRVLLNRVTKTILLAAAILIALPMVGINLTTLSVFGGALGVGLGFGLQKITANYISGFIILLDGSIRINNLISVGNDRGIVREITTRYTVLRAANGIESIVPNELLVTSIVQNETFTDTSVALGLTFQVAYDTDLEQALAILVAVAGEQKRILKDPAPAAYVTGFADSGINLRLGCWIQDPGAGTMGVSSAINLEVWRRFKQTGISMPFPQREIRILPSDQPTMDQTIPPETAVTQV